LVSVTNITVGLHALLLGFPALFSIVNPLAGAIIFNEVTAGHPHQMRLALARRVAFNSTIVMIVSLWGGSYILNFFGISLNALRLAGGFVVAARAYQMLITPGMLEERKQIQAETAFDNPGDLSAIAFFPLTLPFTTGPGTIAVAVTLGTERPLEHGALAIFFAGLSVAAVGVAGTIWITYALSDRIGAVLGLSGRRVVARLAAFLLLGIGVQIMLSGAIPVLHQAVQ
jgi:multiple antibiotic resistance protein